MSPAGELSWRPTESQGPSTNTVTVVVSDSGSPALSALATLIVRVAESNRPPVLTAPADLAVDEGQNLTRALQATDPDMPLQSLSFGLVEGPLGLTVGVGGLLHWTPSEAQGPSTNLVVVRVADSGNPSLNTTNSFLIRVREVNSPPTLTAPPDRTLDEGELLTWSLTGADGDWPAQALSYSLVQGPAGMEVTAAGELRWTPGEFHGPSTNEITVRVSDDGSPVLSSTAQFTVIVREVNQAPSLTGVTDHVVGEEQPLNFFLIPRDADHPAQTLTLSLLEAPEGMTMNPIGEVTWTPGESQGPFTHRVTVRVVDDGVPPLSATNHFEVQVREVNSSPSLPELPDQTLEEGQMWSLSLPGEDRDLPPQSLTYALVGGPLGLQLNLDGLMTWSPTPDQAPSTNVVTVRIQDDGNPSLSATGEFRVIVREIVDLPELTLVPSEDGTPWVLEIRAADQRPLVLESAPDLADWTEIQRLTGLGKETPIRILLPSSVPQSTEFWRVRADP